MATFRQRKGKWQVQVRRLGHRPLTKTFITKTDATRWANQTEAAVDRHGVGPDITVLRRLRLADILERFRDEVCPMRRGQKVETIVINAFLRTDLAKTHLADLTPEGFAHYRDKRLKVVRAGTVNRELGLIQRVLEVAKTEWAIPLSANPLRAIRKPSPDEPRERRLRPQEWERIEDAAVVNRNSFILPLIKLAVATGMRRSEMLNARWCDLNWPNSTLRLPMTKNGKSRIVPLSDEAKRILANLGNAHGNSDHIVPISSEAAKLGWQRLVKRAGLEDFRFHDLRHEAVSRFFEAGLSVPEVSLISGHRDPRMLFRYTHLKAEDVAKKLVKSNM